MGCCPEGRTESDMTEATWPQQQQPERGTDKGPAGKRRDIREAGRSRGGPPCPALPPAGNPAMAASSL